jgi:hypothetical protein
MCLRYYSRMRLGHNLTPLLLQAEKPRVISIFAAGQETRLHPDDLSLRSHYGLFNVISHGAFMTTFFFEELVAQNPKLSCLHVYPGLVKTQEFQKAVFPAWLKWVFRWILLPLLTPWCVPVAECGERSLFCAGDGRYMAPEEVRSGTEGDVAIGVDGQRGSGVYAVDWNGEVFRKSEAVYEKCRKKDMRKMVWEHTMEAFKAVEEGKRFAG